MNFNLGNIVTLLSTLLSYGQGIMQILSLFHLATTNASPTEMKQALDDLALAHAKANESHAALQSALSK